MQHTKIYQTFIHYFAKSIKMFSVSKDFLLGNRLIIMKHNIPNIYLFQERCSKNSKLCKDGLDKYGLCCWVYDKNKKIFKTRYSDYPW